MSKEYKTLGKVGHFKDGTDVYTFQVGSAISPTDPNLVINPNNNLPAGPVLLQVDNHSVLIKGTLNNNDDVIEGMIKKNRMLPQFIEKQAAILQGKGIYPYKAEFVDNMLVRKWEKQPEIMAWLDSFEANGFDSATQTMQKILRRYYTFEEYYIKMVMRATRFIDANSRKGYAPPVVAFELVENKRCRLASPKKIDVFGDDLEEKDFTKVFVGNWTYGMRRSFKKYVKLTLANLLKHNYGIAHFKNDSVGDIYGVNKYFEGVKDWIDASNLTPKNINSFIRNSLAAKTHIVVPSEWYASKEDMLQTLCDENRERAAANEDLITMELLDGKILELGTEYRKEFIAKYFKNEIEKCVRFLSGPENQGKIHATLSYRDEKGNETKWLFETIKQEYKDYVEPLIKYDKRADDVITMGIGLPANISNVDKDGIISKSGSDLFYSYIIYLHSLTMPEEICMRPYNLSLRVNRPDLYAQGYRLGLHNTIPEKQEETSPSNRLKNQQV